MNIAKTFLMHISEILELIKLIVEFFKSKKNENNPTK